MPEQTLVVGARESRRRRLLVVTFFVVLATFAVSVAVATAAPSGQPKTPHAVAGRENCLACHQPGGAMKPAPANHSVYKNDACLGCHPLVAAQPGQPAQPQATPQAPQSPSDACLTCHGNPDLAVTLPSGERLSLYVDRQQMSQSVHGGKLQCSDCHKEITGVPHPPMQAKTHREYSLMKYEVCRNCHGDQYEKTQDSVHNKALQAGNPIAPLCTDCHGYHSVVNPDEPRNHVSTTCGRCHGEVYRTYENGVHGAAMENGNRDVPVCTDCHATHSFGDPNTPGYHLNIPELCAKCHADPAIAGKYGMKSNVYDTYVRDFHGATVALAKKTGMNQPVGVAVCTDCHGTHEIHRMDEGTTAQIEQRAVERCQQCHTDAGGNFPDAWLGHFALSITDTPAPWLVRLFYWLLIPYMLIGLTLHILADFRRSRRRRH